MPTATVNGVDISYKDSGGSDHDTPSMSAARIGAPLVNLFAADLGEHSSQVRQRRCGCRRLAGSQPRLDADDVRSEAIRRAQCGVREQRREQFVLTIRASPHVLDRGPRFLASCVS